MFLAEICGKQRLCVVFRLQNLTAAIHAALQVDVVRTVKLTRIRVFHICRLIKAMVAATPATPGLGDFTFRDRHGYLPQSV